MLTVYCRHPTHLARIRAVLPSGSHHETSDWNRARRLAEPSTGIVAFVEWLSDPVFEALCSYKLVSPLVPVLLITRGEVENTRRLKDVLAEEVIWIAEIDRALVPALQRMRTAGLLNRAAALLEAERGIPPLLRHALCRACRGSYVSVKQLAADMGRTRAALAQQWREHVGPAPLRLEDVLDWIVLLRAVAMKSPGRSWMSIAGDLRVHQQTIGRIAKRLHGTTLRELAAGGQHPLDDAFRRRVLRVLIARPDMNVFS
jgi:hypothetical protein